MWKFRPYVVTQEPIIEVEQPHVVEAGTPIFEVDILIDMIIKCIEMENIPKK